jgi:hypothetical protein
MQHFIFRLPDGVLKITLRARIQFTAEQKVEMWDRWQRGDENYKNNQKLVKKTLTDKPS